MGRIKISRKKILQEPDEFLSLSQRVWLWVHENQTKALAGVGGVAGVLLLALLANGLVQRGREKRAVEGGRVVAAYLAPKEGAPVPADAVKRLEEFASKNGGTAEGTVARFFLAGALATQGQGTKAAEQFTAVGREAGKDADLAALAGVAQSYVALASGDADRALAGFQEAIASQGAVVPRSQLRMEAAAILEKKGRAADARRLYEEVLKERPDGALATRAKERLAALEERERSAS